MWSGFDVISHQVLAAEYSNSFLYIKNICEAVIYFSILVHIRLLKTEFLYIYTYNSDLFFLIYIVLKSPVFVKIIPECKICNFHDVVLLSAL